MIRSKEARVLAAAMASGAEPFQATTSSRVNGLSYPNVGEVILEDSSTGSVYRAPIVAGTDGRVRYTFESIPRGTYRLQAYLFYRHPLDPPTALPRMYSQLFNGSSSQSDMVVVLEPNGAGRGFHLNHRAESTPTPRWERL
jgi:hypothetical protein